MNMRREDVGWGLLMGGGGGLLHGIALYNTTGSMWVYHLSLSVFLGLAGGTLLLLCGFNKTMRARTQLFSAFLMGFIPGTSYAFLARSDNIPVVVGIVFGVFTLISAALLLAVKGLHPR
jgi:hypothetical protein